MHVNDKLIRSLTEAKYLNAENVDRYRCIMRIFYENYEKLRYCLYQEDVYDEMLRDPQLLPAAAVIEETGRAGYQENLRQRYLPDPECGKELTDYNRR